VIRAASKNGRAARSLGTRLEIILHGIRKIAKRRMMRFQGRSREKRANPASLSLHKGGRGETPTALQEDSKNRENHSAGKMRMNK